MPSSNEKPVAVIEDWVYDGVVLYGHVTKHINQNTFKKRFQQTSHVIDFNMIDGFAETENTFYQLGKPGTWADIYASIEEQKHERK